MKSVCPTELMTSIRVQKLIVISDGMGGRVAPGYMGGTDQTATDSKWVEWFSFWAKVTWLDGDESLVAGRIQAKASCTIEAHWDERLTPKERLVLPSGKILNIVSVNNREEQNEWADIKAIVGTGT